MSTLIHTSSAPVGKFVPALRYKNLKYTKYQTVDNPSPMRHSLDTHGGIVKGGGYAPLHVQSTQNWELFSVVPSFALKLSTLCRQLEYSCVFVPRSDKNLLGIRSRRIESSFTFCSRFTIQDGEVKINPFKKKNNGIFLCGEIGIIKYAET